MVQEIIVSPRATRSFEAAIRYLEENFSEKEIAKFTAKIDKTISHLVQHPYIGQKVKGKPSVYKTVINKRIVLYYEYKPVKKVIVLLVFWNTWQDPKRLRI